MLFKCHIMVCHSKLIKHCFGKRQPLVQIFNGMPVWLCDFPILNMSWTLKVHFCKSGMVYFVYLDFVGPSALYICITLEITGSLHSFFWNHWCVIVIRTRFSNTENVFWLAILGYWLNCQKHFGEAFWLQKRLVVLLFRFGNYFFQI